MPCVSQFDAQWKACLQQTTFSATHDKVHTTRYSDFYSGELAWRLPLNVYNCPGSLRPWPCSLGVSGRPTCVPDASLSCQILSSSCWMTVHFFPHHHARGQLHTWKWSTLPWLKYAKDTGTWYLWLLRMDFFHAWLYVQAYDLLTSHMHDRILHTAHGLVTNAWTTECPATPDLLLRAQHPSPPLRTCNPTAGAHDPPCLPLEHRLLLT